MLNAYLQTTRRLLADATFARYNEFDLRDWCNIARAQVAGEGEAIRLLGTLPTVAGQPNYNFSAITLSGSGIGSALAVRMIGAAGKILSPRPFEWMFEYYIAPLVASGTPVDWSQLGQGTGGTLYLGPTPNAVWTMTLDVVATPDDLVTDADAESLPWPFRDAVPYYAAYMALLTTQQFEAAERHYQIYERFVARARAIGTPTVLPEQYPGSVGAQLAARATPVTPASSVPGGGGATRAPAGGGG